MRPGISLWGFVMSLMPILASAQELPPFQVKGYGVHANGQIVYHYRVINNNPTNVANPVRTNQVEIGRMSLDTEPELTGMPSVGSPPVYDTGVLSISAPSGWRGVVSGEEEHVRHTLLWETIDIGSPTSSYSLLPGQMLTGFSVSRRNLNPTYLDGHFFIIASEGAGKFTGLIEREDVTPPLLTLVVNPKRLQAKTGTLVNMTATIKVSDDYDPAPEIRLESITANEPVAAGDIAGAGFGTDDRQFQLRDVAVPKGSTGRVYTIIYSATDASGNKATASARVSVK